MSEFLQPPWLQHARLLSSTLSQSLLTFLSIDDAIQPSHPLSPPSPSALNLSQHQDFFQWVGSLHQVAKVYSGLISFRIDWFDLLAFQGTLKSFLQHNSSKASKCMSDVDFFVILKKNLWYCLLMVVTVVGLGSYFLSD